MEQHVAILCVIFHVFSSLEEVPLTVCAYVVSYLKCVEKVSFYTVSF
jgi:hypothetical protein